MNPSSSQEVAVLLPLLISLVATLATIAVHAVALAAVAAFIRREHYLGRAGVHFWRDVAIISGVTVLALVAHLLEMTIWAVVFVSCGEFTRLRFLSFRNALYLRGIWRCSDVQFLGIVGAA